MPQSIRTPFVIVSLLMAPVLWLGCGSSDAGPAGGAVVGAVDMHCTMGAVKTKVETGMCVTPQSGGGQDASPDSAATSSDGGTDGDGAAEEDGGAGGAGGSDFGETMFNNEGDDDDCKYHIAWTSSPIRKNTDVTFDVTAKKLFDDMPATDANTGIEAFLTDTHPTPSVDIISTQSPGGHYRVGPVRFDQSGTWTVRFHLYQMCIDSEDSPHGHAAFFVQVP